MSKARNLSAFISEAAIDATEIGSNAVTTDKIIDQAVTPAKLHNTLDLSSKTVTLPTGGISGNAINGGVISNFASTGIDDNASSTAVTILSDGKVGIGTDSPTQKLNVHANDSRIEISTNQAGTTKTQLQFTTDRDGTPGYGFIGLLHNNGSRLLRIGTNGNSGTDYGIQINSDNNVDITNKVQISPSGINYDSSASAFSSGAALEIWANNLDSSGLVIGNNSGKAHTWFGYADGNNYITGDSTNNEGATIFRTYSANPDTYAEKMRIQPSGNVGIGSTGPTTKLEINESSGYTGYEFITLSRAEPTRYRSTIGFGDYAGGNKFGLSFTTRNADVNYRTMTMVDGKVGIGTSSPVTPLDVTKAGGGNFVATFQNTTSATPYGVHIKDAASGANGYPLLQVTNSAGSSPYLLVHSGTGRVGINTNAPSYTLDVNGKARAYGFIGHVIKEWNITGSYSQGTSYVFTTRSYISSLGWGDGMYRFVVYSDTYNAGTGHYQIFVAYNAFYFVQQSSNAPQAFTMGWNVAMGHAPNSGTRAVDLVLRHRYGSASPNAADQQFEFIPVNGFSNLSGGAGYNLRIRLFKIP